MDRAEKHAFVDSLRETFTKAGAVVVAHYAGLSVAEMGEFRVKVREAGGSVKVAKNRLARIALKGTEVEHISDRFQGQTLIVWSEDPIAAPKAAVEYAKSNEKLIILGAAMGSSSLEPAEVKALASLPSLDELRAKILGLLSAPATRIAQMLQAPGGQVARVISARSQDPNAPAGDAPAATAEAKADSAESADSSAAEGAEAEAKADSDESAAEPGDSSGAESASESAESAAAESGDSSGVDSAASDAGGDGAPAAGAEDSASAEGAGASSESADSAAEAKADDSVSEGTEPKAESDDAQAEKT